MRILQINKNYYIKGGADKVFFDTIEGLQKNGHEISVFSTHSERNLSSDFDQYFVPGFASLKAPKNIQEKYAIFRRMFRSSLVEARLSALVLASKPEVAHIHNAYRELSASTFLTLKKLGVPMVMTVHDMFPLCPNHSFMLGDTLAEEKLNKPYKCLGTKCINNSFSQSLAGVLEAYYYRHKKIWDTIDRYICPSEFVKNKLIEYGFPSNKMRLVRYPIKTLATIPALGTKIVYLGRLDVEKGIKVFMEAIKQIPNAPVVIAGTGPEEAYVKNFIAQNNLTNVSFRGFVSGVEWQQIMAEAKVIVVPSIFYETGCLTMLESMSYGRLVVAANRGAIPEAIIDGQTGLLFQPEDGQDLAHKLEFALKMTPEQVESMKPNIEQVLVNNDPQSYIAGVEEVYREVI